MKNLLFPLIAIALLVSSCSKNDNANLEQLSSTLQANESFQSLASFKANLRQKQLSFYQQNQGGNATFKDFIQELGLESIDAYRQYLIDNQLIYVDKVLEQIPELATLDSQEFTAVWQKSKKAFTLKRESSDPTDDYIDCMWNAWNNYDLDSELCIMDYNLTQNLDAYTDCLNTATNNAIFLMELC